MTRGASFNDAVAGSHEVRWPARIARIFLPDICALCDRVGQVLCSDCSVLLRPAPCDDAHVALYLFDESLQRLIHRFKYDAEFWLLRVLAPALRTRAAEVSVDALVPIPLHPRRLRERGFNQSLLLARAWGKILGRPVIPDALERIIDTSSQTGLDKRQRLANLAGAFQAVRPGRIAGKSVLLVDDVRTTGATLDVAGEALRRAGARGIKTATVAIVP
jgi:ComF family protein